MAAVTAGSSPGVPVAGPPAQSDTNAATTGTGFSPAIFGTQQPQLMSTNAGPAASATRAASARRSGLEP